MINFDIAAIKNINVGRDVSFQFRGEFFNAFNHTNFSTIDTNTDHSTYGRILGAANPRQIQLGGKMYF